MPIWEQWAKTIRGGIWTEFGRTNRIFTKVILRKGIEKKSLKKQNVDFLGPLANTGLISPLTTNTSWTSLLGISTALQTQDVQNQNCVYVPFKSHSPNNCVIAINYAIILPGYSGWKPWCYFIYYTFAELFSSLTIPPLTFTSHLVFPFEICLMHIPPCIPVRSPRKQHSEKAMEDI